MDCLLEGPSFESLRSLASSTITIDESPRIRLNVEDDDEDWVEAA